MASDKRLIRLEGDCASEDNEKELTGEEILAPIMHLVKRGEEAEDELVRLRQELEAKDRQINDLIMSNRIYADSVAQAVRKQAWQDKLLFVML